MTTARPETFDEYVGQDRMKARLRTHVTAARNAKRTLDHVLLIGPAGCGKTTLANIIANEVGRPINSFVCPIDFETLADMTRNMTDCVVFMDEIHRFTPREQENLFPLLEDGYLQRSDGWRLYVDNLTIIGATTEPDQLLAPLQRRFPIRPDFDDYTDEEMAAIVQRMLDQFNVPLPHDEVVKLGKATGSLPGSAEALAVLARDLYENHGAPPTADLILNVARVTPEGLTRPHQQYLEVLEQMGGIAGLGTLATHLRRPQDSVRELEWLLVKLGKVRYGRKGRELVAA